VPKTRNQFYDMPDDQIIGFWGKRPFIGKGIPRPIEYKEAEQLQLPSLASATESAAEPPPPQPEPSSSWRADPRLFRHWRPAQAAAGVGEQT
jgi:hypothetical protein